MKNTNKQNPLKTFNDSYDKKDLKDDFDKFFVRGNKTAGTRIRKVMQELKKVSR